MKKYVFRKYTQKYLEFFSLEKKRIVNALGFTVKIEHVGSTVIAGLGGKGIVDIVVGVSKAKLQEAKKKLEKAGYEFREKASFPERLFFRRDYIYHKRNRRVHIHLVKFNGRDWRELVSFRNYLLKHPEVVEQYVKIKKEAVEKADGLGEVYRKHKEKFIKNITKKALGELPR